MLAKNFQNSRTDEYTFLMAKVANPGDRVIVAFLVNKGFGEGNGEILVKY